MVNSKKNTKSIIALVVLSLLLIASICLAATGAWFTSKTEEKSNNLVFGTIEIATGNNVTVEATTSTIKETTVSLMPGDVLKISYDVENKGEAAYVIAKVTVTATAAGKGGLTTTEREALEGLSGLYAATGNVKAKAPAEMASGKPTPIIEKWEHSVEVTGAKFGNKFQGATVTVKVQLFAIQQENLDPVDAFNKLQNASIFENDGIENNS